MPFQTEFVKINTSDITDILPLVKEFFMDFVKIQKISSKLVEVGLIYDLLASGDPIKVSFETGGRQVSIIVNTSVENTSTYTLAAAIAAAINTYKTELERDLIAATRHG